MEIASPARTRHCRGFTLIELLAVMAIMAMMMGVAVYSFIGYKEEAGIRTSSLNFSSGIAHARQWAITHRQSAYLLYGNTADYASGAQRGYYVITTNATPTGVTVSKTNWLAEGIAFTTDTNCTQILDEQHRSDLWFRIDGTVRGGTARIYITMAEREKVQRQSPNVADMAATIVVPPLTGLSRVKEKVQ